jgi:drug/metabolite transporter (DMT)-like permease
MIDWLWIPVTMFAAAAQTVRNAVQRNVTKTAGVLPAAFIRFFYGLPFAVVFLAIAGGSSASPLPTPNAAFIAWVTLGAVTQVLAAALFVASMTHRSFVVSVVFSKTEVVQVAVYSILFLGESVSGAAAVAILLSTVGVVLLAGRTAAEQHLGIASWLSRGALLGLAAGAMLAVCAVGYRGAMLQIPGHAAWVAAAYGLVWAQVIQTLLLGGWLFARDREGLMKVVVNWRESLPGGLAGALASFGWFTAFALRSAVDVRIVGLVEVFYSYAVSTRLLKEHVRLVEVFGIALVVVGIVLVSLAR